MWNKKCPSCGGEVTKIRAFRKQTFYFCASEKQVMTYSEETDKEGNSLYSVSMPLTDGE